MARFGGDEQLPTPRSAGRWRAQLRAGLGMGAILRSDVGPCRRAGGPPSIRPPQPLRSVLDFVDMDDGYELYELYTRGTALLEDGHHHQATIPLTRARDLAPDKTSIREALGPSAVSLPALRAGSERVRSGDRARPDQRLWPCSVWGVRCRCSAAHAEAPQAAGAGPLCLQPGRRDYRFYRDRARARAAGA